MIDVAAPGLDAFLGELAAAQAALNIGVNTEYRRLIEIVFSDVLKGTPQWSGNLAANWFVGINSESELEQTLPEKSEYWPPGEHEPFNRKDPNEFALEISAERLALMPAFSYLDQAYIYNPAYPAEQVEQHTVYLRPVNLLGDAVMMTQWAASKYADYNPLS